MKERGFDYIPQVPESTTELEPANLPEEEFARIYGFGVSTSPPRSRSPLEDSIERPSVLLSEAERLAYAEALYGTIGVHEEGTARLWPGCQEAGYLRAFPSEVNIASESLFEELRIVMERASGEPAMIELEEDWSECMASEGHPGLDGPQSAVDLVASAFADSMHMTEVRTGVFEPVVDVNALTALQGVERELATASWECRRAVDYEEREGAVIRELEDQFVTEHRQELDEWLTWYRESHG